MIRATLLVDLAIAVVLGVLVLVLSPGLAVSAIIAILVLVVCGISLLWSTMRSRRRARRRGDWR